jgi:hypothetical protein
LVYYGCLVLLDIFSFGAIYAPTAEISSFVVDDDIKEECVRYVRVPRLRIGSEARTIRIPTEAGKSQDDRSTSSASQHSDTATHSTIDESQPPLQNVQDTDSHHISHETLILLYTSLRQGLTMKKWVLENLELLTGIDVRRLITFGIIKGFLYRVHKYAIATSTPLPPAPPTSLQTSAAPSTAHAGPSDAATVRGVGNTGATHHPTHTQHPSFSLHRPSMASTTSITPQKHDHAASQPKQDEAPGLDNLLDQKECVNGLPLLRFLDGMHSFDEICTELGVPEKVVEGKVRGSGDGLGAVIHR